MNFKIPSGSSVGVVGRTGAGKSTLLAAISRLVEVESGRIILGGIPVSNMNLKKLRENVSVIP